MSLSLGLSCAHYGDTEDEVTQGQGNRNGETQDSLSSWVAVPDHGDIDDEDVEDEVADDWSSTAVPLPAAIHYGKPKDTLTSIVRRMKLVVDDEST